MKKLLALLLVLALCFTCFAACKGKVDEKPVENSKPTAVVYDVEDAAAYLKNMYKKYLVETETAADYTLVSQVMVGGVVYKVTWTTDRDDIKVIEDAENKQVKIDLNEKTKVDIKYTLTATVTDPDGKTKTLTFELKVPKYVLSSWKEYMAMEAGKAVVIEGYVAAIHSQSEGQKYNMLYVHDVNNAGGYYIYSMTADPIKDLNLKRGMLVSVTGTKDIYSGTHEIKDASVNVLDTKVVNFAPVDITSTYKEANSLSDEALVSKLGMYVTIKGVEITDQDLAEKSQYYNFKLAGLTSYIRLYRTDCPCSVSDADMKAIANGHTAKKGYYADVSGIVVLYNGSIYLNPISKDCFKYGAFIKRTDAEKVEVEMDEIKFDKDVPVNKTLNLPSKGKSYENVVITWKSNSDAIEIKDGKAYIKLQAEATTASMTATFTLGTITKTKTYTFNLAKKPTVIPQEVANPVNGTAYKLFFVQAAKGEFRYFTGEMNGYYGASTVVADEAVDVYVETTNNGYYMYFNKDGKKQYITLLASGTHINFVFQTTKPDAAFVKDTEHNNAPVMTIGGKTYFIGTFDNYVTFGTSEITRFETNYVAYLGTMVDTTKISDADKVAKEKEALSISATNFSTDSSIDLKGTGTSYDDVKITWASNNACAVVADGKLNVTLQETAQTVTLTATLTCGTVTATKTFNITVDAKPSVVPVVVDTPVAGTAYKLYLVQGNLMNKGLYFIGTSANEVHFLSTSTNYTEGVDVFVEIPAAGKYYLYFMDGTAKKYLTIKLDAENRARSLIVDEANKGTAFIWNAENKTFYMEQLNDAQYGLKDFYMGTYNSYETISASNTGFISTSFPVHLVTMVDTSSITDADKVAAEKDALALEDEFFTDAEIDLTVKGVTYEDVTITWASNNAAAVVNNGKLAITSGAEDVTATITATITCGNATQTKTFEILIHAIPDESEASKTVTKPIGNKAYKFFINQVTAAKELYLDGTAGARYLNTTTDITAAADVYAEIVTDGYKFYILDGTTKKYITAYKNSSDKDSLKFDAAGENVFTYDATVNVWKTTLGDKVVYLGTYSNFETISASGISYITAENTGVSQFPAELIPAKDVVTDPFSNKAYTMFIDQYTNGQTIYLDGTAGARYLNTTTDIAAAAKVYVEVVTDGYKFYILNGTEKQYLTAYKNSSDKDSLKFDAAGENVFTYDASVNAWKTTFNDAEVYIGTYSDFTTASVSKITYITPENTGVSQFPVQLQAVENIISKPTSDKEFVFGLYQATNGAMIYLDGTAGTRYLNTTTDIAAAAKVYAEVATDGYKFYILDGTTKKYITAYKNSSDKDSLKFDAAGESVFTYDAELNVWKTNFNEKEYYLGTYSNFDTISLSGISYITHANSGVSQFALELSIYVAPAGGGEGEGGETGGEGEGEGSGSTTAPTIAATFTLGTDDPTKTNEGATGKASQDGKDFTTYTETNNGYTLSLTDVSKVYENAYDATGKACLKLGTKKLAGKFTFTVAADVTSVKIYVAGYKDNKAKFKINGGAEQQTTKLSANGEYDVIVIDTTTTKTITFETVSGGYRCKINTIEFYK